MSTTAYARLSGGLALLGPWASRVFYRDGEHGPELVVITPCEPTDTVEDAVYALGWCVAQENGTTHTFRLPTEGP